MAAPAWARPIARSWPMPLLAPVTRATLPARFVITPPLDAARAAGSEMLRGGGADPLELRRERGVQRLVDRIIVGVDRGGRAGFDLVGDANGRRAGFGHV